MKFPTIIKKCESKLLSARRSTKPLIVSRCKNEIHEYLVKQNKYRNMYFNLAFGKCKYKELFIEKFYKTLPKYTDKLTKNNIENWERKYYLLVEAFQSTGALI